MEDEEREREREEGQFRGEEGRREGLPHQLCLLWKLTAAVGSFSRILSCPLSLCSPDIASYAEKPPNRLFPSGLCARAGFI